MPCEVKKCAVVDDKTIRVFPHHRGLHVVIENLARYAAEPRARQCDSAELIAGPGG